MLRVTTSIRVRYQETDKMGIAYHGNYFTWLEVARIHLLDSIGCPYKELEENGYFLPVIRCECEYKSPARFDDIIDVVVHFPALKQARVNLEYSLTKGETLIANAKTLHAFVDLSGRVIKPPGQFVEKVINRI
ncbi:MAG: thioesterase family protein [Verrucomicrobiota bacterium]|nr:thioesterase family protein [Verrucomicrobiota bacterium]